MNRIAGIGIAALCTFAGVTQALEENVAFSSLNGYWSGRGSVNFRSGAKETLKCVTTYKVSGSQLTMNMRCASQDYPVNIHAQLTIAGGDVSGTWRETKYEVGGSVRGSVSTSAMSLRISGQNLNANVHISFTGNEQRITMSPEGTDVRNITIAMRKG